MSQFQKRRSNGTRRATSDYVQVILRLLSALSLCLFCQLIKLVATDAGSTTSSASSIFKKPSLIDLSYLHRTKSSLLAQAVKHALLSKEQKNTEDDTVLDLDVDISASLVEKNFSDLILPLMEARVNASSVKSTRRVGIIAQRNQLSKQEATLLLEAILGPEKEKEETNHHPGKARKRRKTGQKDGDVTSDSEARPTNQGNKTMTFDTKVTITDGEAAAPADNTTKSNSDLNVSTNVSESLMDLPQQGLLLSSSVARLDLGWNDLGGKTDTKAQRSATKAWHQILQRAIQSWDRCPTELRFPVCGLGPAACRAMGKGLMARYDGEAPTEVQTLPPALSLHLTRNERIGDPGVAALSAAVRTVAGRRKGCTIFDCLDLSGCGITDAGAEALAVALEQNPLCIRHLILSNNEITNSGASALGLALALRDGDICGKIETLDLSNNKGIGDAGAKALALALEQGCVDQLIMRSCHIYADGAAALVKSLKSLSRSRARPSHMVRLDLSGNPLGILRKKAKSGGGKYSATALRSKASATTAAYMSLIGKTVQKGLKDLGIAESGSPDTLESDDEEESQMNEKGKEDEDPTKIKCGALAIADALLSDEENDQETSEEDNTTKSNSSGATFFVELGLRHCAFDTRASEALAAVRQELLSSPWNMDVTVDVRMNNVLEEDTIAALRGDHSLEAELSAMAERYLEAMEAIQKSQQRSLAAAEVAQARMRAELDMGDSWGSPVDMGSDDSSVADVNGNYDDEEERWDSDADYDQEDDIAEFY